MLNRIKNLSHRIQLKLEDKSYMKALKGHMKPDRDTERDFDWDLGIVSKDPLEKLSEKAKADLIANDKQAMQFIFPHYLHLVAIACTYHLREELVELLTMGEDFPKDIRTDSSLVNQSLIDQPLTTSRGSGPHDTVLGIASFHGYLDLVTFLVEEKKADVNASSMRRDTPLHQVVKGDSYPENHHSYGNQHAEVAQYLITHGGDIKARNKEGRIPLEEAQRAIPPLLSSLSSSFANIVRKEYFADRVRPILEKAQKTSLLVPEIKSDAHEHTKKSLYLYMGVAVTGLFALKMFEQATDSESILRKTFGI